MTPHIDVIATTISGSIRDWGKVKRIVPLFEQHGYTDVSLRAVDSHRAAREATRECIAAGGRVVISAGGSGTFNAVLEGCCDSGVPLGEVRLGFLRKGSADLIGKVLDMPDTIEEAVEVFARSIAADAAVPCDVLLAETDAPGTPARRFVGYGGAEIFGKIPHFTENRFMKYYKGVLSQLFGDLGPFFVGMSLATTSELLRRAVWGKRTWTIEVDGREAARGRYQALVIVNGDLGPNMPFARGVPLGSGDFHLFAIRDLGLLRLPAQLRRAWNATFLDDPERWGVEPFRVGSRLRIAPDNDRPFPVNTDGSTMVCRRFAHVRICDRVRLIARVRESS